MYNLDMSLIACADKNKKHRVNASGDLQRTDYYCPHRDCNAILTLVDCDDDVKNDHFRVKSGFQHIENCPYTKNDVYLLDNGFTNVENQILTTALNKIDDLPVADVHTHGATRNDPGDEVFSPKDLYSLEDSKNKYTKSFISYVVTPNGSFKKTDGTTQTLVSTDMPKDKNDPIKSITVDILYNPSSGEYCKVPLNIKGREDLIIDTNLGNLL